MAGNNEHGHAAFEPCEAVIAGRYGTWRLTYTAGSRGIVAGGSLRVYTDSDTDWGIPQFATPDATDYMSVESPAGVDVAVRIENQRSLRVFVYGRGLLQGERITLIYGDTSEGSPGSRAQTFLEETRYLWIDVDAEGDGNGVTLANPPCVEVVGDDAHRLVAVAPSTVVTGEVFRVLLKAEDQWGNPTQSYGGPVAVSGDGIEISARCRLVSFADNNTGTIWLDGFKAVRPGTLTITATDSTLGLRCESNPILVSDTATEHQLVWADPHGGQVMLNSKYGNFFRYARDVAGIQFVGFQRNADAISAEDWEVQQHEERALYEPGHFVPIPGFEWSGRTWEGGHHNIYFRRHDQPARRNRPYDEVFQGDRLESDSTHIRDVYRTYRNTDTIITMHVGGEHSDLTHHDPTLETGVEIVSSHGMFEWMLRDALTRGYRLAFLGGSDSYTGRPGDDRPGYQMRRYSKAGLTGVYAKDISLESFHEAMRARRVYATTGARMILRCEADGHPMGAEYTTTSAPEILASIIGSAPLESVELFRGLERVASAPLRQPTIANRVRVIWRGASRMTSYSGIVWDGALQVNGARITDISTLRFDSPRSHVAQRTDTTVRWHAWGCGYPMGLVLDIDNAADAELSLSLEAKAITGPAYGGHGSQPPRRMSFAPSENVTMSVRLSDLLSNGPRELDIGVLDRKLELSLASEPGPSAAQLNFIDKCPQPGVNPYWIRVVQADLETGWTSPVFVDYCPPVRTENARKHVTC